LIIHKKASPLIMETNCISIPSQFGNIQIFDEPQYSFDSKENTRNYQEEIRLFYMFKPSSIHGVVIEGEPIVIIGAEGDTSSVHQHSACIVESNLYLAVGGNVACIDLIARKSAWSIKVEFATCLGIHYEPTRKALISHGEMDIVRVHPEGRVLWNRGGADLFSGTFELTPDFILANDASGKTYRFDYESGNEVT